MDVLGWWPRLDRLDLLLVDRHSIIAYDMPKELNLGLAELAFRDLGIQLMSSQTVQDLCDVPLVILPGSTVYQDVVEVDDNRLVQQRSKHLVHQPHEGGWCIRKTEGKNKILVMSISRSEGGLLHVCILDADLVVFLVGGRSW